MEGLTFSFPESIHVPFSMRHRNVVLGSSLACGSACVILLISILIYISYSILPWTISFFAIVLVLGFMFSGVLLYHTYEISEKFAEMIDYLGSDLIEMEKHGRLVLGMESLTYGKFYMFYFTGSGAELPYYMVWITTKKRIPGGGVNIWKRASESKRGYDNIFTYLPGYVSSEIEDIESLKELRFEEIEGKRAISAIFEEIAYYSEVPDILETVCILKEIEKNL